MRVCHITTRCHAAGFGGTERYILELVRALDRAGHPSTIGWLCPDKDLRPFTQDGARIVPLGAVENPADPQYRVFEAGATRFLLREEAPDILHFHTFGRAESVVARLARQHRVPYAFTYHSVTLTCRRETLLRWGTVPCDGEVRAFRCGACLLQARQGVAPWRACAGLAVSAWPGLALGRLASGRMRRGAALLADLTQFREAWRAFLGGCALAVSSCPWSTPLLELNGAPPARTVLCPPGVPMDFVAASARAPRAASGVAVSAAAPFVVGYVGRLDPHKGIHILLEAFTRTAYPAARLRIYGGSPNDSVRQYTHEVMRRAAQDARISFLPKLPFDRMVDEYTRLSLLAVPSVWPETGPLALFEALQLGVPVWGSPRVGPLDLLRQRGRVLTPNDVQTWQTALEEAFAQHARGNWRLVEDRALRTMRHVAEEMAAAYGTLTPAEAPAAGDQRRPMNRPAGG